MIVLRHTNRAKYGMGDQLLTVLQDMFALLGRDRRVSGVRYLTDVSGPAFTVEVEFQVESLAVWEQVQAELIRGGEFAKWFARVQALVESGHREFFTLRN
jgi:hypothetical protein